VLSDELSLKEGCIPSPSMASCFRGFSHIQIAPAVQLNPFSCSCTEGQHLGSIPDHLSCIHAQQLASGVHTLRAQFQGEDPFFEILLSGNTCEITSAGVLTSSSLMFAFIPFNGMVLSLGSGTIKGVARSFLGVSKKL